MRNRATLLLLALLSALPVQADEISDLRAENARLRAQLEAAQKNGQPAAAAPAAPATASPAVTPHAASASSSATTATPSAPASAQISPAPPTATDSIPATPPDTLTAPEGYKLVRVAPLPPSERYLDTGCSRGMFKGPPPAQWNDANNWDGLQREMTPQQVETLIGTDHHDVTSRNRLQWQYGRCGDSVGGWVLFEDGRVRSWSAPER